MIDKNFKALKEEDLEKVNGGSGIYEMTGGENNPPEVYDDKNSGVIVGSNGSAAGKAVKITKKVIK